jgi:NADH-quinone oxidoreductase subunit C
MTDVSPSVGALEAEFGSAILRNTVSCGDSIVFVARARAHDVLAWLKDAPGQEFNFLTDITAVEYRDTELRIKVPLDKTQPLELDTVYDLWKGADWLEREVYDMFGVKFVGHPDLRRILMWETYGEGYPLRKDFPLRGHFSRAEQVRQALAANPEAQYSLEELALAQSMHDLPADMKERLRRGERGLVP